MSGSLCPRCFEDSGTDAEAWFRDHERKDAAVCEVCGAKLKAYYDEVESEGGYWAFEEAPDTAPSTITFPKKI